MEAFIMEDEEERKEKNRFGKRVSSPIFRGNREYTECETSLTYAHVLYTT